MGRTRASRADTPRLRGTRGIGGTSGWDRLAGRGGLLGHDRRLELSRLHDAEASYLGDAAFTISCEAGAGTTRGRSPQ